jgi:outer membrane lipoprotein
MRQVLLIGITALLLAGCAGHVLPREALQQVDEGIEAAQVLANPEAFVGSTLLLGGPILDIQVGREGTVLELLNYRLDRWGEPLSPARQGGRFLVRSETFLDPEIYRVGNFVTLTGTVLGSEVRALRDTEYRYPVVEAGELHLWSPYTRYTPDYYGPSPYWSPYRPWSSWGYPYYFHDPFWDPFWHRPWHHPRSRFWW